MMMIQGERWKEKKNLFVGEQSGRWSGLASACAPQREAPIVKMTPLLASPAAFIPRPHFAAAPHCWMQHNRRLATFRSGKRGEHITNHSQTECRKWRIFFPSFFVIGENIGSSLTVGSRERKTNKRNRSNTHTHTSSYFIST